MGYVVAGYTIVLSILFLYGVQLVWRRRRLNRAVERVVRFGAQGVEPEAVVGAAPAGPLPVSVDPAPLDAR